MVVSFASVSSSARGGVAQLGERTVRIRKVKSSILSVSTIKTRYQPTVGTLFLYSKGFEPRGGRRRRTKQPTGGCYVPVWCEGGYRSSRLGSPSNADCEAICYPVTPTRKNDKFRQKFVVFSMKRICDA